MIDAAKHHNPGSAPGLILKATEVAGSQKNLAAKLGMTPRYLRMVSNGDRNMDYGMQVMLESLINDAQA